jgi:outer membrane biosynthesis protein TonB
MRRILVASLLSSVALTAAAATHAPATDASGSTPSPVHAVSTGITDAQLYYPTTIKVLGDAELSAFPNPAKVVLKVSVDATGTPTHVEVVQPLTPTLDAHLVKAVRQLHWRPAVLDNQTIPMDVNLVVQVQH